MDSNIKLRNRIIALSVVLVLFFLVFKNWTSISNKFLSGKKPLDPEDVNQGEVIQDGNAKYGVSSANPLVSEIGIKVLEDGGNAVDAAVAMSFALNVIDPQNSGIGGGGGMLIQDGITDEKVFYDYYISSGDVEPKDNIGIPGFLKGMDIINKEMGTKKLGDLIDYAIDVGEQGVVVTKGYEEILNKYNYISQVHPSFSIDGRPLMEGDTLYQPELLETLKEVRDKGVDIFYNGEHDISKNFLELTGISKEALKSYSVHKYEPLELDYRGYNIIAPPAPFSGLTLLQNLMLEEHLDIPEHDLSNEKYNDIMKELLVFTAKEGRRNISDPAFNEVNYEEELSLENLINKFNEESIEEIDYDEPESVSTTAFTVIDKNGTIVSATNTLSNYWGAYVVSDGIIYNNAMKNFTRNKNKFEYNKRPKTGITPVIITNEKGHKEALGANGGAKIPTYLFRSIVNTKKYDMDYQIANDLERMYYLKGRMYFETNAPHSIRSNGYISINNEAIELESSDAWGLMNGVVIDETGEVDGHTDKRNYFEGGVIYYNGKEKIYK